MYMYHMMSELACFFGAETKKEQTVILSGSKNDDLFATGVNKTLKV